MRKTLAVTVFMASLALGGRLVAQVLTPMELSDPKAQHLQQRHLQTLIAIGREIEAHQFPYPFYFCRVLDIDLAKMQAADQRSIRFDTYNNRTVLEITGNYYAAYSADRMGPYERLKETFQQVITPILQAETPRFPDDSEFSAFAIEVSHHVRQKVMGVSSEAPENVTVIVPVPVAQKFVDAKNEDERQAAILEAAVYLNGQPYSLWLREGAPPEEWKEHEPPQSARVQTVAASQPTVAASATPLVSTTLIKSAAPRIITPDALAALQRQNQDAVDRMTKALDPQAHFLAYAAPTFIAFRQGTYLQLSLRTELNLPATSSRYKAAALAFDNHISHLIRPLLDYFLSDVGFDGVDFSSTVHFGNSSQAVEFFFPYRMMQCFANYDCTGQQLIDSGTVVINGERAALDLQLSEGKN